VRSIWGRKFILGGVVMEVVLIIILGAVISYIILYFVIKAAVKNGIIEARHTSSVDGNDDTNSNRLPQVTCPQCNKNYDFDYPKCPYCDYTH